MEEIYLSIRTDNEGTISVDAYSKREDAIRDLVKTIIEDQSIDTDSLGYEDDYFSTEEALEEFMEIASSEPDGFDYYIEESVVK